MRAIYGRVMKYKLFSAVILLSACQQATDKVELSAKIQSEPVATTCSVVKAPEYLSLAGGTVTIGADNTYPEEGPARTVKVSAFDIDSTEVTNAQFSEFVMATGYVTDAEKPQPGFGIIGSAVFMTPKANHPNWWGFVEGADWRSPEGPGSSIAGRESDPVVQVSHNDAKAYAEWAVRRLPTEAEWEYAAKAGSETLYVWGTERTPDNVEQANTWQGAFPIENSEDDGYFDRAPVGCFAANDFGIYDMIGNVWEWTDTIYQQSAGEPIYAIKGGSFLCAENYCQRYRAAARQPQEAGLPTNHIGFRTVKDAS